MKRIVLFFIFSLSLVAQDSNEVLSSAIRRFSVSPFSSNVFISGGAFYSGDDVDRLPMLVDFYANRGKENEGIRVLDGLFGNIIFKAKINKKSLNLFVTEWGTNISANINSFAINEPLLLFPKIFYDTLQYRFIDLNKQIVSSNIVLATNWNTLEIGYKDRVDTIIFSATTSRVRTFTSRYRDNVLTIDMSSYTNISGIAYPRAFVVKSKIDKRELRFNITNIVLNQNSFDKEVRQLGL